MAGSGGVIHVRLPPHAERLAVAPSEIGYADPLLWHQVETYRRLYDHDIVVNSAPTGTGKTRAVLLPLLSSRFRECSMLFLAPTNELVSQQAREIDRFVSENRLPHLVLGLDARRIREIELRAHGTRPGEKLHQILLDPGSIVGVGGSAGRPLILVLNPDIFYYAVFFLFNALDRRNLAADFYTHFSLIVIDEFHIYDAKQFANFLFYLAFSKEAGYFSRGDRKVILLTATPDLLFQAYLNRLGLRIAFIDPEPAGVGDRDACRTLSPVELFLHPLSGDFHASVVPFVSEIRERIEGGEDGCVISDSLREINLLFRALREGGFSDGEIGLITGPTPPAERRRSPRKPLVLATPTVDIGFNFEGREKSRQNLDFLFFEARRNDAFWQRLGRAGRVLGKEEQASPSTVHAFLPEEVFCGLCDVCGGGEILSLSRKELAEHLSEQFEDPESFAGYISSWAVLEVMQPLLELEKMTARTEEFQKFYEETLRFVIEVFAPGRKGNLFRLRQEVRRIQRLRSLAATGCKIDEFHLRQDSVFPGILREFLQEEGVTDPADRERVIEIIQGEPKESGFFDFVERECAAISPLFSFRGGGTVSLHLYDPRHIFGSGGDWVEGVDLFHLLRGYRWREIEREPPGGVREGALVLEVLDILPEPVRCVFTYTEPEDFAEFERRHLAKTDRLTALRGLRLTLRPRGSEVPLSLPSGIHRLFAEKWVPGLVLPWDFAPGVLRRCFKNRLFPVEISVGLAGRLERRSYHFFVGRDALFFIARYGWLCRREEKNHPDLLIV
ncbi:MAG: type I-D CRISPR-associated helicase Cas3' [Deltaproteobacteria bacterium]|nr:MAG: type I-D CRISPR-associated helicase Cas3' [Deltaproteobacteria bacterium]